MPTLLAALKARETRLTALKTDRETLRAPVHLFDAATIRRDTLALAADWRGTLAQETEHTRPLLARLLAGRVVFTPREAPQWELRGRGTLADSFSGC
jgi:hypothetical protein